MSIRFYNQACGKRLYLLYGQEHIGPYIWRLLLRIGLPSFEKQKCGYVPKFWKNKKAERRFDPSTLRGRIQNKQQVTDATVRE